MLMTPERWVHQGRIPGNTTKFGLLSTQLVTPKQKPRVSNKTHLSKVENLNCRYENVPED